MDALVGGFSGERKTSGSSLSDLTAECHKGVLVPSLPGTRTIYKTSGSRTLCVGFRGYCGGFANNVVNEDSERASTGAVMDRGMTEAEPST
jgi:hypothetical protein